MLFERLLSVLVSTLVPVIVIVGIGFVFGRVQEISIVSLNAVTLHVFLPALVFYSFVTTPPGAGTSFTLVVAMIGFTLGMAGIARALGYALQESERVTGALVLTGAFPNVGNFGIPVARVAFGQTGQNVAVLFVVVQNVLIYSLGLYVASREKHTSGRQVLAQIVQFPVMYAVVLALAVGWLGVTPPAVVMTTVGILGDAAVPLFLVILGLQMSQSISSGAISQVSPALVLKLAVAPVLGAAVVLALSFQDSEVANTFVLLCAGPTAISPLLLAQEFNGTDVTDGLSTPEYISSVIFVSLLLSIPVVGTLLVVFKTGYGF